MNPNTELASHWQQLGKNVKVILVSSFIMATGSFLFTPFIAIFCINSLKLDIGITGIVVGISTFTQFSGSIVGAQIAEKIGYSLAMKLALAIRAFSLMTLAIIDNVVWLSVFIIIINSACAALYMPANKAYIVSEVKENTAKIIALSNTAFNSGMAIGPLLAGLFISSNSRELFFLSSLMFLFLFIVQKLWVTTNGKSEAPNESKSGLVENIYKSKTPAFYYFFAFYAYFYFQNFIGIKVSQQHGTSTWGILLTLNFIALSWTQIKLSNWIKSIRYSFALIIGFSMLAVSFLLFYQVNLFFLAMGAILFSFAQATLFLKGDLELLKSLSGRPALAFGVQRLTAGFAGLICGYVGTFLS